MKRLLQVFACVVVVGWSLPAPGDEPSVPYSSPSAHAGQQTAPEAAARTVTLDEAYRLALTNEEQIKLASETLSATLATLKKQVTLAERNYDLTAKQYRVGEATSLDVNNTLNTLNLVRVRLTNQTYAYQLALLNLERAGGTFGQAYVPQR